MKKRNHMNWLTALTILIFSLGLWVRIYHYPERVIFTLEQGVTLSTTYNYLHAKFSLLGLASVQRFTSTGTQIYFGPIFNYFLIPFMYLFGTNPVTLTVIALIFNMLTAIVMYITINRISGKRVALYATTLYLFDLTMISQSLTLWILNPLPLIGIIGAYLIVKYHKKFSLWNIFVLGILAGIGLNLEWMFLITMIPIGLYLLYKVKNKLSTTVLFVLGVMIPMLPTIIFELRHNWFHLFALWQYLLDTVANPGQGSLQIYHFLHLYPAVFWMIGYLINRYIRSKSLIYLLLCMYVVSGAWNGIEIKPVMSAPLMIEYGERITTEAGDYYNLVYMPESEYRAYTMRYIMTAIYNKPPLGLDAYPSSDELYVIASKDRDMDFDIPWEITSADAKQREVFWDNPEEDFLIYKYSR